jgi:hypothetical protein
LKNPQGNWAYQNQDIFLLSGGLTAKQLAPFDERRIAQLLREWRIIPLKCLFLSK